MRQTAEIRVGQRELLDAFVEANQTLTTKVHTMAKDVDYRHTAHPNLTRRLPSSAAEREELLKDPIKLFKFAMRDRTSVYVDMEGNEVMERACNLHLIHGWFPQGWENSPDGVSVLAGEEQDRYTDDGHDLRST